LSEQAKNYVPAFIATIYLMNFYREHDIIPVEANYDYRGLDTLHIHYAVSFDQISAIIDLPVDRIRFINPVYIRDYIPERQPWSMLVLPADKIAVYLQHEISIQGYSTNPVDYNMMVQQAGATEGRIRIIHEVQPGEFTHRIAMKYNCTLENIKAWNNLPGYEVQAGQKLVIWVARDE
jgi:membrane-bound lytic murein transglycosylase D